MSYMDESGNVIGTDSLSDMDILGDSNILGYETGSSDVEDLTQTFKDIYQNSLKDNVTLIPGVEEFIDKLSARNVKLGLVSSAYMWMVKDILSQIGLFGKFHTIITKEDVDKHKPHPQA